MSGQSFTVAMLILIFLGVLVIIYFQFSKGKGKPSGVGNKEISESLANISQSIVVLDESDRIIYSKIEELATQLKNQPIYSILQSNGDEKAEEEAAKKAAALAQLEAMRQENKKREEELMQQLGLEVPQEPLPGPVGEPEEKPGRKWTEEERKAFGERMKQGRKTKKIDKEAGGVVTVDKE